MCLSRSEPERSSATTTVSSRSSSKRFTKVFPCRAVTFQSMDRTSSPGTYSRTSENSRPFPRKALRYAPKTLTPQTLMVATAGGRYETEFHE